MTQGHPVVERYLTRFEAAINEFDFPEEEEIAREIRNHMAEAHAAGEALDAVLQTLGPADVLARAYAVELALNPQNKRRVRTLGGFPRTLVAAGTRPVWALGRCLKAIVAAGMRRVWAVGRFLRAGVAAPSPSGGRSRASVSYSRVVGYAMPSCSRYVSYFDGSK